MGVTRDGDKVYPQLESLEESVGVAKPFHRSRLCPHCLVR